MGLISTRQYDQAMRFLGDVARKIRTSPPMQVVRKLHSQSFQEVQQVQSDIERYYQIQYQPYRTRSTSQPSHHNRPPLPSGRPQSLPPANRQPLGQLPPYRNSTSPPSAFRPNQPPPASRPQQPSNSQQSPQSQQPSRPQQPSRYPQRSEWQQNRPEQHERWER